MEVKEFGRGVDMLTKIGKKEQTYADDHARLNGFKPRDGTNNLLTEHVCSNYAFFLANSRPEII
jgi:hypothetical protein